MHTRTEKAHNAHTKKRTMHTRTKKRTTHTRTKMAAPRLACAHGWAARTHLQAKHPQSSWPHLADVQEPLHVLLQPPLKPSPALTSRQAAKASQAPLAPAPGPSAASLGGSPCRRVIPTCTGPASASPPGLPPSAAPAPLHPAALLSGLGCGRAPARTRAHACMRVQMMTCASLPGIGCNPSFPLD